MKAFLIEVSDKENILEQVVVLADSLFKAAAKFAERHTVVEEPVSELNFSIAEISIIQ